MDFNNLKLVIATTCCAASYESKSVAFDWSRHEISHDDDCWHFGVWVENPGRKNTHIHLFFEKPPLVFSWYGVNNPLSRNFYDLKLVIAITWCATSYESKSVAFDSSRHEIRHDDNCWHFGVWAENPGRKKTHTYTYFFAKKIYRIGDFRLGRLQWN